MVVETQDAAVCLVRREEIPVLVQQRFTLFSIGKCRRDVLGNIGKQSTFYAVEARKKAVFLSVSEVAVEVNYLLCQQLALHRGSAFQLPAASVLTCVQQLGDALGCVPPRDYLSVARIPCRTAFGYAYTIRAHPRGVALTVNGYANTVVVNCGQKCGNFI